MPIVICKIVANYLTIKTLSNGGGVFVAHDATTAQEVQFTALRYVAKKLFIAQVTQFQCVKVILFLIRCITKSAFFKELNLRQLATELS